MGGQGESRICDTLPAIIVKSFRNVSSEEALFGGGADGVSGTVDGCVGGMCDLGHWGWSTRCTFMCALDEMRLRGRVALGGQ